MRYGIIALMMLPLLTGCFQGHSDIKPDVVNYSLETQKKAAVEFQSKACPVMGEMMKDYLVMRDQSRG